MLMPAAENFATTSRCLYDTRARAPGTPLEGSDRTNWQVSRGLCSKPLARTLYGAAEVWRARLRTNGKRDNRQVTNNQIITWLVLKAVYTDNRQSSMRLLKSSFRNPTIWHRRNAGLKPAPMGKVLIGRNNLNDLRLGHGPVRAQLTPANAARQSSVTKNP